jgi:hypothetical protein
MDVIIVAVLIALLVCLALLDIVRFMQSIEWENVWKFLLSFGLPCTLMIYFMIDRAS